MQLHRGAHSAAPQRPRAAAAARRPPPGLPRRRAASVCVASSASSSPINGQEPLRRRSGSLLPLSAASSPSAAPVSSSNGRPRSAHTGVLMVQCPDQKGVVASLAQLLFGFNCNILQSDQFTDETQFPEPRFFQRILFDYADVSVGSGNMAVVEKAIADCAARYDMQWSVAYRSKVKRVAVLVSKMDHCLWDLLIRWRSGELPCDIPVVISNHPDLAHVAQIFGIDFVHLPMSNPKDAACKAAQEAAIEATLREAQTDVTVLARYMQIFSDDFCRNNWRHTINIHHSFLPAFEGARPYHRAHERGVKIIGATAHYATAELDAGPIIEQDIARISHRDTVADMVRKGRDLERLVLARALRWHLQDRVLVHANKTVVFEE